MASVEGFRGIRLNIGIDNDYTTCFFTARVIRIIYQILCLWLFFRRRYFFSINGIGKAYVAKSGGDFDADLVLRLAYARFVGVVIGQGESFTVYRREDLKGARVNP